MEQYRYNLCSKKRPVSAYSRHSVPIATRLCHWTSLDQRRTPTDVARVTTQTFYLLPPPHSTFAMSLRVVSAADVNRISSAFSPVDLQCLMAQVFHAVSNSAAVDAGKAAANVQVPHRTTIETEGHNILFMPARLAAPPASRGSEMRLIGHGTSIKIVSAPKVSDPRGLPGTTLVMDESTGGAKAIVNARTLTALRNAAGTAASLPYFEPSF